MKIPLSRSKAKKLFEIILSGQSTILERMSDGGTSPYPDALQSAIDKLRETLKPNSRLYGQGSSLAKKILDSSEFLGD